MIAASMAATPEDLLHVLREQAGGHPLLKDGWLLLETMDIALSRGADLMEVAGRIEAIYPYGESPREVKQLLYDLYEEVTCAHMHGGVPSPPDVERTLAALVAAARGRSRWRALLESIVAQSGTPQNNKLQRTRHG
jgi:hypothetical protein